MTSDCPKIHPEKFKGTSSDLFQDNKHPTRDMN
jgi:hypothetical protein